MLRHPPPSSFRARRSVGVAVPSAKASRRLRDQRGRVTVRQGRSTAESQRRPSTAVGYPPGHDTLGFPANGASAISARSSTATRNEQTGPTSPTDPIQQRLAHASARGHGPVAGTQKGPGRSRGPSYLVEGQPSADALVLVVVVVLEDADGRLGRVAVLVERDRTGVAVVVERLTVVDELRRSLRTSSHFSPSPVPPETCLEYFGDRRHRRSSSPQRASARRTTASYDSAA